MNCARSVLFLMDCTASLYVADASGNPDYGSPIWIGCCLESATFEQVPVSTEWLGATGSPHRKEYVTEWRFSLELGRLWSLDGAYQDVQVPRMGTTGSLALEIVGRQPVMGGVEPGRWHRRIYRGVELVGKNESGGPAQLQQTLRFSAGDMVADSGNGPVGSTVFTGVTMPSHLVFFREGALMAGERLGAEYRVPAAGRLRVARAAGMAGQGTATVLELMVNNTSFRTLTLAAGTNGSQATVEADLDLGVAAGDLVWMRTLSGPVAPENAAWAVGVTVQVG